MRVAIADDHLPFRTGLAAMLDAAGVSVAVQARSGAELLNALRDSATGPVDAVVVDIRMPPTFTDEGIRTAHDVQRWSPAVGVLVLSAYTQTEFAARLIEGGESGLGYLLKDHVDEVAVLRDALERVVAGESVIDPEIVRTLVRRRDNPLIERLTNREREALELMAEGRSNAGIAAAMCVSEKRVEKYASTIYSQLGIDEGRDGNRRVLAVLSWLRILDGV